MKLAFVTKREKRNRATSKKFDDDVMQASCESNSGVLSYTPQLKTIPYKAGPDMGQGVFFGKKLPNLAHLF